MKPYHKHVLVCASSDCAEYGAEELFEVFKEKLRQHNLVGEVKITKTGCLKVCEEGPVVVVYPEGVWYGRVMLDDVDEIVVEHLQHDRIVSRLLYFAMRDAPGRA